MSSPTPNRATRPEDSRSSPADRLRAAPVNDAGGPNRPPWRERHPLAALVLPDVAAVVLIGGGALAAVLGLVLALGWLGALVAAGLAAVAGGVALARRSGPRLLDLATVREPDADGRWPAPQARAGAPTSPYAGS